MDDFFRAIRNNPTADRCVPAFSNSELRMPKDNLWGGAIRNLTPARLTTAWLMVEDPLMLIAGGGYKSSEVRSCKFYEFVNYTRIISLRKDLKNNDFMNILTDILFNQI
jgi:hypothetical protein